MELFCYTQSLRASGPGMWEGEDLVGEAVG